MNRIRRLPRAFAALRIVLIAAVVSACSSATVSSIGPAQTQSARERATAMLYVANQGTITSPTASVSVYGANFNAVRTITTGLIDPRGLTTDSAGRLYVANAGAGVNVYDRGGSRLLRTISRNLTDARLLTVDSADTLYVLQERKVSIFRDARSRAMRNIQLTADGVTIDSSSNFYLAIPGIPGGSVEKFAPGAKTPEQTITNGLENPQMVAVDARGYVYVGSVGDFGYVTVYPPNGSLPSYKLDVYDGIRFPAALGVDAKNDLYVLDQYGNGSVFEFAAHSSTLVKQITNGLDRPNAMAVAGDGTVYVSNPGVRNTPGDVTVYAPGTSSPETTITDGVDGPQALTLGT